jgi:hypothetical protein
MSEVPLRGTEGARDAALCGVFLVEVASVLDHLARPRKTRGQCWGGGGGLEPVLTVSAVETGVHASYVFF